MADRSNSWEDLIEQVHADPLGVIEQTTTLLDAAPPLRSDLAGLHWVRGLAWRENGDILAAQQDFVTGTQYGRKAGDVALTARIAVSWSIVEMSLGDSSLAHRLLDEAEPELSGSDRGRLLMQRGLLHHRAGDLDDAIDNYRRALPMTEQASDRLAEVRLRLNLGLLLGQTGDPIGGAEILAETKRIAAVAGLTQLAAMAAHNLGYMSALLGRTPEALADYAAADALFLLVNDKLRIAIVGTDRAALYAQAGLHDEAYEEAQRVRATVEASGNVLDLAETELIAARSALAAARLDAAMDAATQATRLFADNGRNSWATLARSVHFMAELRMPGPALNLRKRSVDLSLQLEAFGWTAESVHVRLDAASQLLGRGDNDSALELLDAVMSPRAGLPVVDGIAAWTALAMRSLVRGDLAGTRRAVSRGLKLLESNVLAVQALDLRAHVIGQGRSLAEIGAQVALASGRPREFLARMESARATSVRSATLPAEAREAIGQSLASLRLLDSERRNLVASSSSTVQVDRDRANAEFVLRSLRRRSTGPKSQSAELGDCIDQLGPVSFLGFGDIGRETSSVSIVNGRAQLHDNDRPSADHATETIRFALNRLARGGASAASTRSALELLNEAAESVPDLLPDRIRNGSGPLVISPSASMSGLAWRVIGGLQDRSVCVAPSLTSWALAHGRVAESNRSALIVSGPGLDHADREVELILAATPNAIALRSKASSIEGVLAQMEDVGVAHFACHGSFREDNPLFSSLRLADGDLTIYDLEQCERLPHTIVMSACNAGQNAVLRGGALLGMTSALIQLGVSSVIAPLTPVNDERSVDLMVRLHTHLAAGVPAAEALAKASIGPDGELDPTAAPFICFGS